jgi:hypothetical protein
MSGIQSRAAIAVRSASGLVICGLLLAACAAPPSPSTANAPSQPGAHAPASGVGETPPEQEGPAATGVDLTVTKISCSPPKPKAGDALTFSATVKNRGTVATEDGIVIGVAFQINGNTVSWSDNNKASLGAGQSRVLTANFGPGQTATWTAIAGEHTLGAWVDDVHRLPDVEPNNNTNEATLVVP